MKDDSAVVVETQVAVVSCPNVALDHMEQHPLLRDVVIFWGVQVTSDLGQQEGDYKSNAAQRHDEDICQSPPGYHQTAWMQKSKNEEFK